MGDSPQPQPTDETTVGEIRRKFERYPDEAKVRFTGPVVLYVDHDTKQDTVRIERDPDAPPSNAF